VKYLSQFCIIMGFTFVGEAIQRLLPLPIPGSVYSLVLLFLALCIGLVKLEQVKDAAHFLTSILPILFVAPAVGIVEYWELVSDNLIPIILLILATTVLTFGISGTVVQRFMKKGGKDGE
jgi:holin-like protein